MVADALSRKPANLNALMDSLPPELYEEIMQLNLVITDAHLTNILEVALLSKKKYAKLKQMIRCYGYMFRSCTKGKHRISLWISKVH